MKKAPPLVQFTIIENQHSYPVKVKHGSYPNLMFLLKELIGLDSSGECGGVGRCATCVVKAIGIQGNSAVKERNEPNTLEQLGYTEDTFRLSCQLYITSDLEEAEITLLEY